MNALLGVIAESSQLKQLCYEDKNILWWAGSVQEYNWKEVKQRFPNILGPILFRWGFLHENTDTTEQSGGAFRLTEPPGSPTHPSPLHPAHTQICKHTNNHNFKITDLK